jgi:hypothetical protein
MARSRSRTVRGARRRRHASARAITALKHGAQMLRHLARAVLATPLKVRILLVAVFLLAAWAGTNWLYQTIHKPTELFFPSDETLTKSPVETWRAYGSLFREHSTAVMTPELLAALAQVEGEGNPVARTYWRWRLTPHPFEIYQPASSSVGMYQITDATFRKARHYCIHNHVVAEDGPWNDLHSCWFNSLYTRVLPSHATELTSALLDRGVAGALARQHIAAATLRHKQNLAAVILLCGQGAGDAYARRGFRLTPRQRCGDHPVGPYLARVHAMTRLFARLARTDRPVL